MTTWHRILFSSLLAASLAACADGTSDGSGASTTSASAESTTSAGDAAMPPPGHGAPPPEAVAACDGASAGDPCDFSAHDHDVTGTCVAGPHDATKLACCPEGGPDAPPPGAPPPGPGAPPPGEPPAPPAEALAACASLAADAACSVTLDGHTLEGTCRARSADEPLACAPSAPPPPHP